MNNFFKKNIIYLRKKLTFWVADQTQGFLKQMIRMIVAHLILLGRSVASKQELRDKLGADFEQPKIKAAPAIGLHLVDIRFLESN